MYQSQTKQLTKLNTSTQTEILKLTLGRTYSATSNCALPFEPFGPLVHKVLYEIYQNMKYSDFKAIFCKLELNRPNAKFWFLKKNRKKRL